MLDPHDETPLLFRKAAALIPGRPVHPGTLHRWAKKGVRGVYLKVHRYGWRYSTSAADLHRFFDALQRQHIPETEAQQD